MVVVVVVMVVAMALMIDGGTIRGETSGGDRAAHHGSALFCQKEV